MLLQLRRSVLRHLVGIAAKVLLALAALKVLDDLVWSLLAVIGAAGTAVLVVVVAARWTLLRLRGW